MDWESFYSRFRTPDFIPGYEIQNRLGGGAFGEVYKARKHSIGKAYAIKFLKLDDEAARSAVERELEQVRHFAAIDHPNLVTIEDLGLVMDVPYLVMGYAGEETLSRALRERRLSRQQALAYFVQACRGVQALHERRLVHFDLKPSNIFLKGDVARVGDYGLSKMMSDGRQTLSFGRGTPQYMAPEMVKNRADERADIYSLGVILYESLAGRLPFESDIPGALPQREGDAPPHFQDDFPEALRDPIVRCLRVDPSQRFPSVAELVAELDLRARTSNLGFDVPPAGPAPLATPLPLAPLPLPTPAPMANEARSAAAELTRGAVDVARGVWDGLRGSRGAADSAARPLAGDTLVLHTLSERPAPRVAPSSGTAGTIPVPPSAHGGLVATLGATLQLSIEVLVTLVRGIAGTIARGVRARREKLANMEQRPFLVRFGLFWLRLVGILLLLAALGGVVMLSIVVLRKGVT
ncbi:MAG: serine/threonine protein kinase [Planctomycetes bacterium]|nr:serine/threonine protein kinase [Planctomycetota bacterium]